MNLVETLSAKVKEQAEEIQQLRDEVNRLKGAGMHWEPGNVNPMLALRMNLCNQRWDEGWSDQRHWQETTREAKQRTRQQQRLQIKEQHAAFLRTLLAPPVIPQQEAPTPKQPKGRTEAQKRWGRQTFSPRLLRQGVTPEIYS
jgi:hypothetical protein